MDIMLAGVKTSESPSPAPSEPFNDQVHGPWALIF